MSRLAVILAILVGGCSTTAFDFAQSQGTDRWIRERATYDQRVLEDSAPQPMPQQQVTLLESTSPTAIQFKTKDDRIIPLQQVRQIVTIKRARGAVDGALIGAAIGIALGATLGYSQGLSRYEMSMDCTIVCSKGDAATLKGAMGGTVGLVIGTLVGAVVGHRDILMLR